MAAGTPTPHRNKPEGTKIFSFKNHGPGRNPSRHKRTKIEPSNVKDLTGWIQQFMNQGHIPASNQKGAPRNCIKEEGLWAESGWDEEVKEWIVSGEVTFP